MGDHWMPVNDGRTEYRLAFGVDIRIDSANNLPQ
jgi:hypothetical protein